MEVERQGFPAAEVDQDETDVWYDASSCVDEEVPLETPHIEIWKPDVKSSGMSMQMQEFPHAVGMVEEGSPTCHDEADAVRCDTLSDHEESTLKEGTWEESALGSGSDTLDNTPRQLYIETPKDKEDFLRDILKEFVDKVDPNNLIDSMLEAKCLTESDNESLNGNHVHNRREEARKLWNIMNCLPLDDFKAIVIPELLQNYRHILPPEYFIPKGKGNRTGPGNTAPPVCLRHSIMSRARLSTVADSLYTSHSLTREQHQKFIQCRLSDPEVWELLFRALAGQDEGSTQKVSQVFAEELRRYRLPVPDDLTQQIRRAVPCSCCLPACDLPPDYPPLLSQKAEEREDASSSCPSQDGGGNRLCVHRFQSPGSQYLGSDDPDFKLPEPEPEFKAWAEKGRLSEAAFKVLLRENYTSLQDVHRLEVGSMERFLPHLSTLPGKDRQVLEELIKMLKSKDDSANTTKHAMLEPPPSVPGLSNVLPEGAKKLRLLLVGKTGAGKSSTGNTLLGREAFASLLSMSSKTREHQLACSEDQTVEVMDCPGLFDTHMPLENLCTILVQALVSMAPGPSAVLYMIRIGDRYTNEEFETYRRLKILLGNKIHRYMIVVFTRGDELRKEGKSVEDYIKEAPETFKEVLRECGSRYVVFDNTPEGRNHEQLADLKRKVFEILARDKGDCSDLEIFSVPNKQLQAEIDRRIKKLGSFRGKESILEEGKADQGDGDAGSLVEKSLFRQIWEEILEWLKRVVRWPPSC